MCGASRAAAREGVRETLPERGKDAIKIDGIRRARRLMFIEPERPFDLLGKHQSLAERGAPSTRLPAPADTNGQTAIQEDLSIEFVVQGRIELLSKTDAIQKKLIGDPAPFALPQVSFRSMSG